MFNARPVRALARISLLFGVVAMLVSSSTARAQGPDMQAPEIKVTEATQRLDMTANSSRILTLNHKIPKVQVNNPDILQLSALSPTQVQIFAKRPGVTQVNIWNENNQVRSIDIVVYGDAQELTMALRTQFPTSTLRVAPLNDSVVISGYVDRPEQVSRVVEIANVFYPKVINNIEVSGVQQVLLHVKIMEVSRTKLRTMGFDFAAISGGDFLVSSVSGLIASGGGGVVTGAGGDTVRLGIVNGNTSFFGFLEALRQNDLMKILAEPTLVTVSGRPANFQVGGEFPILVPQSLGTVSIEYKKFGTQVDFVPIVLGNGRIHLEVRPRVSEIDTTRGVTINDITVPGLRVREVDTAVEMKAGQTLALAGLIQTRVEAQNKGLPFLADLPWIGAAFRRVTEENNEVELLIMVTPELVGAMDAHEVPPGGPGMGTQSPRDCDLFWRGHLEVPLGSPGNCDPHGRRGCRGQCGGNCDGSCGDCGDEGQPGQEYTPGTPGEVVPPTPVPTNYDASARRTRPRAALVAPVIRMPGETPTPRAARPQVVRVAPVTRPTVPASARQELPKSEIGFVGPVGYDEEK